MFDDSLFTPADRTARALRSRVKGKHHVAALAGVRLPTTRALLLGSPWFQDDVRRHDGLVLLRR